MPRRLAPILIFTSAYMLGAIALAATRLNREFLFYIVLMLVEAAVVVALDRRVRFPTRVLWGLSVWGLLHMCGGLLRIPMSLAEPGTPGALYNLRLHPWAPKYDQVVHAFGFAVSTLAAWHSLTVAAGGAVRPTAGPLTIACLVGLGLGALNETVEFAATLLFPYTNVGGYTNTGWDLVSNLVGSLGAIALIRAGVLGSDTIKA
jgi:hypothetical protein